ncbi:MAG: hypothetical protein J5I47_07800 [Vicingus serpentipes]|nr:hypothetical protein [Vicingus serpentipes]
MEKTKASIVIYSYGVMGLLGIIDSKEMYEFCVRYTLWVGNHNAGNFDLYFKTSLPLTEMDIWTKVKDQDWTYDIENISFGSRSFYMDSNIKSSF